MTQDEMNADLFDAQCYLGCTSLTVDRSRHETTDSTALWIFDGSKQIASLSRCASPWTWEVSMLEQGQPYTCRREASMLDAIGHVMRSLNSKVS